MAYLVKDGTVVPFHQLKEHYPGVSFGFPPEAVVLQALGILEVADPEPELVPEGLAHE